MKAQAAAALITPSSVGSVREPLKCDRYNPEKRRPYMREYMRKRRAKLKNE